jgi:hypothetical protein
VVYSDGVVRRPFGELAAELPRGSRDLVPQSTFGLEELVESSAQMLDLCHHLLAMQLSLDEWQRFHAVPEQQQPQAELRLSKRLRAVAIGARSAVRSG